ncbi:MAG: ABC transporter permease, partial [Vicinamibacterales bacterium]|nr:ABC transporter permease [Vicinamibacterales bacterium]
MLLVLGHTFRRLTGSPVRTMLVVLTLAAGFGIGGTLLAVIDGVWIRAVPYRRAGDLLLLSVQTRYNDSALFTRAEVQRLRTPGVSSLPDVAAFARRNVLLELDGRQQMVSSLFVDVSYFAVLGESPTVGRFFRSSDATDAVPTPVVISERLWRTRFAGEHAFDRKRLTLNGLDAVVIGVVPERMAFIDPAWVFRPLPLSAGRLASAPLEFNVLARLRPGVSLSVASAQLGAVEMDGGPGVRVAAAARLRDTLLGADVGRALALLTAAVVAVLLCMSVNAGSIILAGMARRRSEMGVRVALGATRSRLAAELLPDGIVTALVASSLGLILAEVSIRVLIAFAPRGTPRLDDIRLGFASVLLAASVGVIVSVLVTVIPGLSTIRKVLPVDAFFQTRQVAGTPRVTNWGRALTVAQTISAVVVLSAAAVLGRSFMNLARVDPGFDPANVVAMTVDKVRHQTRESEALLERDLVRELRRLPGVTSVAVADQV